MAGREHDCCEATHRMPQYADAGQPERCERGGRVIGVPRHPGGTGQLTAAAATAQIGRDHSHAVTGGEKSTHRRPAQV